MPRRLCRPGRSQDRELPVALGLEGCCGVELVPSGKSCKTSSPGGPHAGLARRPGSYVGLRWQHKQQWPDALPAVEWPVTNDRLAKGRHPPKRTVTPDHGKRHGHMGTSWLRPLRPEVPFVSGSQCPPSSLQGEMTACCLLRCSSQRGLFSWVGRGWSRAGCRVPEDRRVF